MSGIKAKTELRENPHSLNEEKEILACHQFEAFKESLLVNTLPLNYKLTFNFLFIDFLQ